jgi:flagellar hook assembly protein FlgD
MIQYDLDRIELVTLVIYDVGGRVVRSLVDARQEPGRYEIQWDGRDERGKEIGSGVYFYRLQAGTVVETRKMLVLK